MLMLPCSSLEASWSETAPMPWAGRQLDPVARQRMTKVKRREVTRRLRSKKMPPRKGWKKRCTMASLKPSSCPQATRRWWGPEWAVEQRRSWHACVLGASCDLRGRCLLMQSCWRKGQSLAPGTTGPCFLIRPSCQLLTVLATSLMEDCSMVCGCTS